MTQKKLAIKAVMLFLLAALAVGCTGAQPVAPSVTLAPDFTATPMYTATQTATPLPPTATATAEPPTVTPSITSTPGPTETPTVTPTSTRPPTPVNPIRIFMIAPDTGGKACGGTAIGLATNVSKTGDVAADVETALQLLFANKSVKVGGLLNPVGRLNLKIESVRFDPSGLITVLFIGDFPRPDDKCDRSRIRAQVFSTIRQFPEIKATNIFLNGGNFGDFVSNE